MNINELTYLLGAYLIVSDEEIDINELQVLHTLPVSSESINLKQKGILSNNDDKISANPIYLIFYFFYFL